MKVFSKENVRTWANECYGKEVKYGMCEGYFISDDWCEEVPNKIREENKMKFKIGDRIRGIKGNGYCWTNEEMTEAEVIETYEGKMKIKIISHDNGFEIGEKYDVDNDDAKFELLKITKSDLKDGDIVTLRNGERLIFFDKKFVDLSEDNTNLILSLLDFKEDLTADSDDEDEDIVKIERPTGYSTIYKREEVKKMTLEEISKALGYDVKIVK